MAKITEVYMLVDGKQTGFTMQQFQGMRKADPAIRSRRFIPVDNRLYESTPEQFRIWQKDRKAYKDEKKRQEEANTPKFSFISWYDLDDDSLSTDDVGETVVESVIASSLRSARERLAPSEQELITALFYDGMTEREYAKILGISQPAVHKRLKKVLAKLKKYLGF